MKNTMTQKNALVNAIAIAKGETLEKATVDATVEVLERMFEVANKTRKESPKQKENKALAEVIMEHFNADATPLTVTEIIELNKFGFAKEPINVPRITRICSNLIDEGRLQKFKERRATLFTVAEQLKGEKILPLLQNF